MFFTNSVSYLVKTFWGWRDQQLPDGTVIWNAPSGHTYVTTPGSALLFPGLCAPTAELPAIHPTSAQRCTDRSLMMPKRRRTRAQNRADYKATERRHNRDARQAGETQRVAPNSPHTAPHPPRTTSHRPFNRAFSPAVASRTRPRRGIRRSTARSLRRGRPARRADLSRRGRSPRGAAPPCGS
jgi:hypothetical protein